MTHIRGFAHCKPSRASPKDAKLTKRVLFHTERRAEPIFFKLHWMPVFLIFFCNISKSLENFESLLGTFLEFIGIIPKKNFSILIFFRENFRSFIFLIFRIFYRNMENFFRPNFREIFKTSREFNEIILRMNVSEFARGCKKSAAELVVKTSISRSTRSA